MPAVRAVWERLPGSEAAVERHSARFVVSVVATLAVALLVAALPGFFDAAITLANPGPDLVVESIQVSPAIPDVGQTTYLTFTVRNAGNANVVSTPFENWIYIDPVDRPPSGSTPRTAMWGLDTLNAGQTSVFNRTKAFTTVGCDHAVYVWTDHGNTVSEDNEGNNVLSTTVCVGVTGTADSYEPDGTCGTARWITNTAGIAQHHTLWPEGDSDWAKFSAVAGVTYTIEAKNLGMHANPVLYLYTSCGSLWQFGTGPKIVWQAPANGLYYVEVADGSPTHGPLADYDLSVTADASGIYDPFEPDDTCMAARDINTDGARQTHYFQVVGDQDWVKFPMQSGETYVVLADAPGTNVSPQVALFNTCGAAFGAPMAQGAAPQVESAAPGVLYARATNLGSGSGPTAHYDLSVNAITCLPDGQEEDDLPGQARSISAATGPVRHNFCPAGDRDWEKFSAISGTTYVLETSNLGPASDTEITLYDTDGVTELARNDDWMAGLLSSRVVWLAPANGVYYVMVRDVKEQAAGANTRYDLTLSQGVCTADVFDASTDDNGPLHASLVGLNGLVSRHNLCPRGDQDWSRFVVSTPGTALVVRTSDLAPGADTVLYLYNQASNLLAWNDDFGPGGASMITYTAATAGTYYVQALNFDTNAFGAGTSYSLSVAANLPPTPTPSPTPTKTPTPTPAPTPPATSVRSLILVNRQRVEDLYGADDSWQLMGRLYQLADHQGVGGAVVQVELAPAVASAYAAWTTSQDTLLNSELANDVASAIRSLILSYMAASPSFTHIVLVGDDRVIPFRRVADYTTKKEDQYAASMTISTTQWAAAHDQMTLTDDYYADRVPSTWSQGELYIPDYGIGRLVETPEQIMAFIDGFLARDGITASRAMVTAYDFVQDSATMMTTLLEADSYSLIAGTLTSTIGYYWNGSVLRQQQLQASPRYDIQSINGHADHATEKGPDGDNISAAEIITATADLSGTVIYSVGCHSGLNDTGSLDLTEAFATRGANYVANTGYGWGNGGVTWSEALLRNYTRELLRGVSVEIGTAFTKSKAVYFGNGSSVSSYDHKVLQEATLYGLPMFVITTGATLADSDPFPGVNTAVTTPGGGFGQVNTGTVAFSLNNSFGTFDRVTTTQQTFFGQGTYFGLNDSLHVAAGEPVQPAFYANLTAPSSGFLRGVLFLGGVYTDIGGFDPIIAQPMNETISPTAEPVFIQEGWFPPAPFSTRSRASILGGADTVVAQMGQFNSSAGTERLFSSLAFDSYYSADPDEDPPQVPYVAGILNTSSGKALIKVEASDPSGVSRVLVAYTQGQGQWLSQDLAFDPGSQKWRGEIPATIGTAYLVQAVDGAGNLTVNHNKGTYFSPQPPAPLVTGGELVKVYLPLVLRMP